MCPKLRIDHSVAAGRSDYTATRQNVLHDKQLERRMFIFACRQTTFVLVSLFVKFRIHTPEMTSSMSSHANHTFTVIECYIHYQPGMRMGNAFGHACSVCPCAEAEPGIFIWEPGGLGAVVQWGAGRSPEGTRGFVPQKQKQFTDTVYRF